MRKAAMDEFINAKPVSGEGSGVPALEPTEIMRTYSMGYEQGRFDEKADRLLGEGPYKAALSSPLQEGAEQAWKRGFIAGVTAESFELHREEDCPFFTEVESLKEEVSKLSTRIDEYELAETKAVEELARVREERNERQQTIGEWAVAAFGKAEALSLPQRGLRLLEEAAEAAQASGVDLEQASHLMDYVWSRPVGRLSQELGGVGVTTLALAHAAGFSADGAELNEVARVLSKPLEHFTKRNQEKNEAGLLAPKPLDTNEGGE